MFVKKIQRYLLMCMLFKSENATQVTGGFLTDIRGKLVRLRQEYHLTCGENQTLVKVKVVL